MLGGLGGDNIATGTGQDTVIGDHGMVQWNPAGTLRVQIASSLPALGGGDTITTGDGDKTVVGGFGADLVRTGSGADTVLGDNGQLDFSNGVLTRMRSTDVGAGTGGSDSLLLGGGRNTVVAGNGADLVVTGNGADLVLGDNGRIDWDNAGLLASARTGDGSNEATRSGDDDLQLGDGDNSVVGGAGADRITTGQGRDTVLGDNGVLTWFSGQALLQQATGTAAADGGADTIRMGAGHKLVIGGAGADSIRGDLGAGPDWNVVLGDGGQVDWSAPGLLLQVQSTDPSQGGDDTITLGDGNSVVLGGAGADTLATTGTGRGVLLGDNGSLTLDATGTRYQLAGSLADVDSSGGNDRITTSNGDHLVIGGQGSDTITTGSGNDWVLGDSGSFGFDADGRLASMRSTLTAQGGDDTIDVGDGDNRVFGGTGSDRITSGSGADLVLGDSGDAENFAGTEQLQQVRTTDAATGSDDAIDTGDGLAVVLGGAGADRITAGNAVGLATTVVLGDSGQADWSAPGVLLQVQSTAIALGGNDTITLGEGDASLLGGQGSDQITAGRGNHRVAGDNVLFSHNSAGALVQALTTDVDAGTGGDDTITLGDGDNLVLGGLGADTITTGNGQDLVLGDGGEVLFSADGSALVSVTSVLAPAELPRATPASVTLRALARPSAATGGVVAGNDTITVGDGAKTVLGGVGADAIQAGAGNHVVFGDNGRLDFNAQGLVTQYQTLQPNDNAGDADSIDLGDGDSVVFGGLGADQITTGAGNDTIVGDNGALQMDDSGSRAQQLESTELDLGGADEITTGGGAKTILGGAGADTVQAGVQANTPPAARVVFGDAGRILYNPGGVATRFQSLNGNVASGGADVLALGDGINVVLGGAGGDSIRTGDGDNLVLGDGGLLQRDATGSVWQDVASALPPTAGSGVPNEGGGADQIVAGTGRNILIGGQGGDSIRSGAGADLAFGDNVRIRFVDGLPVEAVSTDLTDASGGNDNLDLGNGDNTAMAGVGSDAVTTGAGRDTVLGDGGSVLFDATGLVVQATTGDPNLGGDDSLALGDGDDVGLGGAGNDDIRGEGGRDTLAGDGARVTQSSDGRRMNVLSIDVTRGGADRLDGGSGIDVLVGGQGRDLLVGSLAEDLLFGSNAAVTVFDGLAESIQADMHDLGTRTLFGLYGSSESQVIHPDGAQAGMDRSPADLHLVLAEWARAGSRSPLAADALRNLFHSALGADRTPSHADAGDDAAEPAAAPDGAAPANPAKPGTNPADTQAPAGSARQPVPATALPPVRTSAPTRPAGTASMAAEAADAAVAAPAAGTPAPETAAVPDTASANAGADAPLVLAAASAAMLLAGRGLLDRRAMQGSGAGAAGLSRQALDAVTRRWFGATDPTDPAPEAIAPHAAPAAATSRLSRVDW